MLWVSSKSLKKFFIILAIAIAVVVILILVWFQGSGGKLFGGINEQIGGLGDKDKDGIADTFDKCPCDPKIGSELAEGKQCGPPISGCEP